MYIPKYTITNKILQHIGIIEASREVINHAPLLPYYEKKFQSEALVRSVHHGTHIEGNELNFTQAERVIMGQQIIARERDIQEVLNYRRVMDYIDEIGSRPSENVSEIFTPELLFMLHTMTVKKIMPAEAAGKYRSTQVVIKNSHTGEVSFRPPQASLVPEQMHQLLVFLNKSTHEHIHPVLKSGIAHYEFARIHPFVDGNGRMARALSTLILSIEGYDIRKFFSLEEYFDSDAASYYESLQSVAQMDGDVTKWLEYFTQGMAIELVKIKELVESVSVDAKIRERLGGKPILLSDRQLKIIEYIQKAGHLENKAFKMLFPMVSEDTVLNEIKSLVSQGIIKKTGVTKSSKYIMA